MNSDRNPTSASWKKASQKVRRIFRHPVPPLLLVALALIACFRLVWPKDGLDDLQTIADLGVFSVALLALTLAVWRFGIEGRQASAAESLAEAAREQADAAKQQIEVAEKQTKAAQQQADLTKAQIEATQALVKATSEQAKIAEQQTKSSQRLASAANRLAKTAEDQAATAKGQLAAATNVAEAAISHAKAAEKHADAVHQRAQIEDHALMHDRYQRAARMLGDKVQAVRIGGVYLLHQLAQEQPDDYRTRVIQLFASFARHPENDSGAGARTDGKLRADVQAVMDVIGSREPQEPECQTRSGSSLDLAGSNLEGANLRGANLRSVNLENASLLRADLTEAALAGARIKGATLAAKGVRVVGLRQEQLDSCWGGPSDGPNGLEHVNDLIWKPGAQ